LCDIKFVFKDNRKSNLLKLKFTELIDRINTLEKARNTGKDNLNYSANAFVSAK